MIIDTHVHIGGDAVGFHMHEDMVIEAMKRYGIDFAIVSNADAGEVDHIQNLLPEHLQVSQEEALSRTIQFARKYPDKIGVAAWVKPLTQGMTKEFEKIIYDNKDIIYGIKLHPFHSNVSPTDRRMLPYIELAGKLNIPVVSHTGGCENAKPELLYEAARLFPDVSFVMVHMGLGSDMPIDGVDTYRQNKYGDRSLYQDYFYELPKMISSEDYVNLMYQNAMRIFRIEKR